MAQSFCCGNCKIELNPSPTQDGHSVAQCPKCRQEVQFYSITPPKDGVNPSTLLPTTRLDETEATCYNHGDNVAVTGCEGCGRLICTVCSIPVDAKTCCPVCWDTGKVGNPATNLPQCMRYDLMANAAGYYDFLYPSAVFASVPLFIYGAILQRSEPVPPQMNNRPFPFSGVLGICYGLMRLGLGGLMLLSAIGKGNHS